MSRQPEGVVKQSPLCDERVILQLPDLDVLTVTAQIYWLGGGRQRAATISPLSSTKNRLERLKRERPSF